MSSLDDDEHALLERIRQLQIAPLIDAYRMIKDGWTNVVGEINDTWVFRFVRDARNTQVQLEQDALTAFTAVSPLNIPVFAASGPELLVLNGNFKIIGFE